MPKNEYTQLLKINEEFKIKKRYEQTVPQAHFYQRRVEKYDSSTATAGRDKSDKSKTKFTTNTQNINRKNTPQLSLILFIIL